MSQKTNIIENMGVMLLIAFMILVVILVLGLLRFLIFTDYRIYRVYMVIKQRIFYNTIFRYIMQSTLKLQIAASDTIVAEYLISYIEES